jgi:hypothetical protein
MMLSVHPTQGMQFIERSARYRYRSDILSSCSDMITIQQSNNTGMLPMTIHVNYFIIIQ